MSAPRRILIVGGGVAGVYAALGAREANPAADIVVLSEECCAPFDRTALSKEVLFEGIEPSDKPLLADADYQASNITLRTGVSVTGIDPAARTVATGNGDRFDYDRLILATGATPRRLAAIGDGIEILYLRTADDGAALRDKLRRARRVAVVGAGLIGLEVAAAAVALGVEADVIEAASAVLARSCDGHTAAAVERWHLDHGVRIHKGCRISTVTALPSGGIRIAFADRDPIEADLLVAGIGVTPNTVLAEQAGIEVRDGILVDQFGLTSVAGIYAAGDVARLPLPYAPAPVRLETWRHAQEHGRAVGINAAGGTAPFDSVPIYWSDQFGRRIQGAGLLPDAPRDEVVRTYSDGSHSTFVFDANGCVTAAVGVDRPQDINGARRLIAARKPVDRALVADPSVPLNRIVQQTKSAEEKSA